MILAFDTRDVRTLCEDDLAAIEAFGPEVAAALRARLADLDAAETLAELVAGRPRLLDVPPGVASGDPSEARRPPESPATTGSAGTCLVLDLTEAYRLVLAANHPIVPRSPSGALDWSRVIRIKLLRIEPTHLGAPAGGAHA